MYNIQTPVYTLQPGDPNPANFNNTKDQNFGVDGGHIDEVNPSSSKNFGAMDYNRRPQNVTIPAYSDRDRFPETKTKDVVRDDSKDIKLTPPEGEYRAKIDAVALKIDCINH